MLVLWQAHRRSSPVHTDTPPQPVVTEEQAVARLFDLAREGDTQTREYQLLDYVIHKRLLQTYGGDIPREPRAA